MVAEPVAENASIWSAPLVKVPALPTLMDASACQAVWSLAVVWDCNLNKISFKIQLGWDLPQAQAWNFPETLNLIRPETHWPTTITTNSGENCLEAGRGLLA